MRIIDEKLSKRRNYIGVIVQDWKDYEVMR